jgi:colicin import membrane protein
MAAAGAAAIDKFLVKKAKSIEPVAPISLEDADIQSALSSTELVFKPEAHQLAELRELNDAMKVQQQEATSAAMLRAANIHDHYQVLLVTTQTLATQFEAVRAAHEKCVQHAARLSQLHKFSDAADFFRAAEQLKARMRGQQARETAADEAKAAALAEEREATRKRKHEEEEQHHAAANANVNKRSAKGKPLPAAVTAVTAATSIAATAATAAAGTGPAAAASSTADSEEGDSSDEGRGPPDDDDDTDNDLQSNTHESNRRRKVRTYELKKGSAAVDRGKGVQQGGEKMTKSEYVLCMVYVACLVTEGLFGTGFSISLRKSMSSRASLGRWRASNLICEKAKFFAQFALFT